MLMWNVVLFWDENNLSFYYIQMAVSQHCAFAKYHLMVFMVSYMVCEFHLNFFFLNIKKKLGLAE
jgi:hypothetical protein